MSTQERHQRTREALGRDGQHALDLHGVRWRFERDVAEERTDRGQSQVARSSRDAASLLQLIEEGNDQGCVDVLERQRRRRLAKPPVDELQQQPERVAVGGDRVRAGLTLLHQPLREEGFQQ